jgi:TPR repeat protein
MAKFHIKFLFARIIAVAIATSVCMSFTAAPVIAAQAYRYVAPNPHLKALHKKMIRQKILPTGQLRVLADSGDRLAAYLLARTFEEQGVAPSEPIHYYTIAVQLGQVSAVDPLISLVRIYNQQLNPRRLELAHVALVRAASRNQGSAAAELARFYLTGTPFGLKTDEAKAILSSATGKGNAEAAFLGATILMDAPMDETQKIEAKRMLTIAASAGNIMAQSLLEELAKGQFSLKQSGVSQ